MTLPEPVWNPPLGYLDAVGGQPLIEPARQAWASAVTQAWADPARLHHLGRKAGLLLDTARASLAASLGVRPDDVFLTTSGPTAAGVAVQGLVEASPHDRAVVSAVESLAISSPAERWARDVEFVPVDRLGRLDLEAFAAALTTPAAVACVQAANAEVGTIQPLTQAAALARQAGVPLLVHAVQVIGRMPTPTDWDVLVASARDWGGPAGVGLIAIRPHVRWRPDENPDRGWVGGFPDIASAAAAAIALEHVTPLVTDEAARLSGLVTRLRTQLPSTVDGIELAGDPDDRLPHILTFTVAGVTGESLVAELDRRGVFVASGSACTGDARMPSRVLEAMGMRADASVRVSLPFGCSEDTVELFLSQLPEAVQAATAAPR